MQDHLWKVCKSHKWWKSHELRNLFDESDKGRKGLPGVLILNSFKHYVAIVGPWGEWSTRGRVDNRVHVICIRYAINDACPKSVVVSKRVCCPQNTKLLRWALLTTKVICSVQVPSSSCSHTSRRPWSNLMTFCLYGALLNVTHSQQNARFPVEYTEPGSSCGARMRRMKPDSVTCDDRGWRGEVLIIVD